MIRKATDIFNEWAEKGRDEGMKKNHSSAVETMLNYLLKGQKKEFDFIDAGCGNGWVVREMNKHNLCKKAIGVDGAKKMIQKAVDIDGNGIYHHNELMDWVPKSKVAFIHSMEVLYYFENPEVLIKHMVDKWLKPKGKIISGLDFYSENISSHSWPKALNTEMKLLSIDQWRKLLSSCGVINIETFQTNASKTFPGTLVLYGEKS